MSNKTIYLSTLLIAFLSGCLITYIAMTKQQMDAILQTGYVANSRQSQPQTNPTNNNTHILAEHENTQKLPTQIVVDPAIVNQAIKDSIPSTNDYSQTQAHAIIDDMPDYVLAQYIDKFMAQDASSIIDDKRRFAERAVEELYTPNDNQPLQGDVKLSLHPAMPINSLDTSIINKNAKLYAHLDLSASRGQIPASPYVFIKWVNNQTGQVLLFEQKSIKADSDQNWVSFKPYEGWQVGSYDIRFYQFTSELQPIAQLTYDIYEVVE